MWAAVKGQVDAVKTLIEWGADVNKLTKVIMYIHHVHHVLCGCSYMYMTLWVCSLGNMSSGTYTHSLTFSISTQDGLLALDYAQQLNYPQVCEILERHGAKQTGPCLQVLHGMSVSH